MVVSKEDIQMIKPGHTVAYVMGQREAIRTQARLSWYTRYGSLPVGVVRFKSSYDKEQGVLLITAIAGDIQ
jgi:hypothetical protein